MSMLHLVENQSWLWLREQIHEWPLQHISASWCPVFTTNLRVISTWRKQWFLYIHITKLPDTGTREGQICKITLATFFFPTFIVITNCHRIEALPHGWSSHKLSLPRLYKRPRTSHQCAVGGLQSKLLVIPELSLEILLASSFAADVIGDRQNLDGGRDESQGS